MQAILGQGAALRSAAAAGARCCSRGAWLALPLGAQRGPIAAPGRRLLSDSAAPTSQVAALQPPSVSGNSDASNRVYADWTVYKSKGAMSVKFIRPTWVNAASPGGGFTVDRPGKVLLEFAAPSGDRQWAWDNKITLAMSALELGEIFSDPEGEHSFYHDPNVMDSATRGSLSKSLRWTATPDKKGYFLNASVTGGGSKNNVTVMLSKAEYMVFETLGRYAIPHLLGLDMVFSAN